ncbi:MAG: glycine cleavage system aminomethyltransferase GcvT [Rhodanobacteraceae bacterium]|nr:MAG: glycine cleavage system aminomethyltransferase GcvT [Rhodanobacteraceae bacterium]
MSKQTILNATHRAAGAKMVDFGGWDMPLHYGSQIEEHHAVRRDAGMFDVSHMTAIDMRGVRCREFLGHLLANSVGKLKQPGKALYSCMLNEHGGVVDDLITYFASDADFRTVVNAATRDKDLAWLNRQARPFGVAVIERPDLAMLAVQGPNARARVLALVDPADRGRVEKLGRFYSTAAHGLGGVPWFVARTGYTGEDGFEIHLANEHAVVLWQALAAAGVHPAGLGARDTLRLEAGMNLYGQDMTEEVTPWEAGLAWTVALDAGRDFIGRAALEKQKADGVPREMIGLVMDERGVLRHGQRVITDAGAGQILSGIFSPTLGKAIAFARVPAGAHANLRVDIRGRELPVRRVKYPFVRDGKPCEGV